MNCKNCGVEFDLLQREGGGYARNLCICENKKKCACGLKATQANISLDGVTIEEYVCDTHGMSDTFKELEIKELPPIPKTNRREKVDASKEYGEEFNDEWIKNFIKKDTYIVVCSSCKHQHNYSDRLVKDLQILCPKCKGPAYKPV